MSTTQRNAAPTPAVVSLPLSELRSVRAAIVRDLAASGRFIADLAGQYTLDRLDALGDDDVEVTLERTLDVAAGLLATIVAIDAQGVCDDEEDEDDDYNNASSPPSRPRYGGRHAGALRIAGAAVAGIALLTQLSRRRRLPG